MIEQLVDCFRDLPDYLGGHVRLSVTALAVGLAVSVPLGIAASRRRRLAELALGAAGVIQTVPSLALLVLMVPLLGGQTGFAPAFLALILYSILPILANTIIGIREVDPVLIEAGRGNLSPEAFPAHSGATAPAKGLFLVSVEYPPKPGAPSCPTGYNEL